MFLEQQYETVALTDRLEDSVFGGATVKEELEKLHSCLYSLSTASESETSYYVKNAYGTTVQTTWEAIQKMQADHDARNAAMKAKYEAALAAGEDVEEPTYYEPVSYWTETASSFTVYVYSSTVSDCLASYLELTDDQTEQLLQWDSTYYSLFQSLESPFDCYYYTSERWCYYLTDSGEIAQRDYAPLIPIVSGAAVYAPMGGQVTYIESDSSMGAGAAICISSAAMDEYVCIYGLATSTVISGLEVSQGAKIGTAGSAGIKISYSVIEASLGSASTIVLNPVMVLASIELDYDSEAAQALIEEAMQHLGAPYVFGASGPDSFDCSGFVSYAINNCSAYAALNMGRLTAQGLYDYCTPVEAAEVQPGDLIFFCGTYDTGDSRTVTHVGIVVGDGLMIHAGHPVQLASYTTSYWTSHFYAYGRLPSVE